MDYIYNDSKFDLNNRLDYKEYREIMLHFASLHCYETAIFWAEKLMSLSKSPKDVYCLAQYLYLSNDYHRAAMIIINRDLHMYSICCCYLASLCLYKAKQFEEANSIIENEKMNAYLESKIDSTDPNFDFKDLEVDKDIYNGSEKILLSSIFLLKGSIYESIDRYDEAVIFFKDSLYYNPFCIEAFECLVRSHVITLEDEQKMIDLLLNTSQLSVTNISILNAIYLNKMNKFYRPLPVNDYEKKILNVCQEKTYDKICQMNKFDVNFNEKNFQPPIEKLLQNSVDMIVPLAEKLFYNFEYKQCEKILNVLLARDVYHPHCLVIHISCLVEMNEKNSLFLLSHKLIEIYSDFAISWYAVGCYYYLNKSYEQARKYLLKSATKKITFGLAWLVYGHTFAVENEHDRAMSAYFRASKLIKGCHLPFLYIGLQCSSTNNSLLAQKYFTHAMKLAPNDPFVKHEMGVVAFKKEKYKEAYTLLTEAKKIFPTGDNTIIASKWEALLCNLGHTCRKLQRMNEALSYFHEALRLNSNSCHIYSSIGLVKMYLNNHFEAIDWLHKALAIRKNDPFAIGMLNLAITDCWKPPLLLEGVPNEIPKFIPRKSGQKIPKKTDNLNDNITSVSGNDAIYLSLNNEDERDDFYSPLDMSIED